MFTKIIFLLITITVKLKAKEEDFFVKDDKLVVSPAELVDLVWEEQKNGKDNSDVGSNDAKTNYGDHVVIIKDLMGDKEKLRERKVWSRWSKWSKCSVSCGAGTLWRRRYCVAGRCAPGEREEQRRACALPPCAGAAACASASMQDDSE